MSESIDPLTPASAADEPVPTNEVDSEIAKWQEEARRKFVTPAGDKSGDADQAH